ncbi:post-GPI attachment to proteins factor 2-like [Culicoides brevitarsis]|uniref:post-GPI attachment to proteins factor 2-like n=1 Tax=Culicoides brevitarsis TaxID=469753 RepID=UPI00307B8BC0
MTITDSITPNKRVNEYDANELTQYAEMQLTSPESRINLTELSPDSSAYSIQLTIPFRKLCVGTLLLPLCSMFICFTTAYIFQSDDIHETHCRVYNIIPSISAITGISPQRYLWRISIAIHVGPRFLIAFAYRNFYNQTILTNAANISSMTTVKRLINTLFYLSIIEIIALTGVTYISNKENYPIHEKIFITFMVASLLYMLLTIVLWKKLYPNGPPTAEEVFSLKLKKIFFVLSILSAISLVIFFAKHRFLCHDMAFSWFATSEYLVALFNMANHITSVFEFSNNHLMVTKNIVNQDINASEKTQDDKKIN